MLRLEMLDMGNPMKVNTSYQDEVLNFKTENWIHTSSRLDIVLKLNTRLHGSQR